MITLRIIQKVTNKQIRIKRLTIGVFTEHSHKYV